MGWIIGEMRVQSKVGDGEIPLSRKFILLLHDPHRKGRFSPPTTATEAFSKAKLPTRCLVLTTATITTVVFLQQALDDKYKWTNLEAHHSFNGVEEKGQLCFFNEKEEGKRGQKHRK